MPQMAVSQHKDAQLTHKNIKKKQEGYKPQRARSPTKQEPLSQQTIETTKSDTYNKWQYTNLNTPH